MPASAHFIPLRQIADQRVMGGPEGAGFRYFSRSASGGLDCREEPAVPTTPRWWSVPQDNYLRGLMRRVSQPSMAHSADGPAGERRAAAALSIGLCAESSHATLQEDGAKLDLKITFKNRWTDTPSLVAVHCQVKHGDSFQYVSKDHRTITLQFTPDTIQALGDAAPPALLIWVPPWPKRKLYWFIVKRGGLLSGRVKIKKTGNVVTPALRFELIRSAIFGRRNPRGPEVVLPPYSIPEIALAKSEYAALKQKKFVNPLLGPISITRLAWRHITRRGRRNAYRRASFRILPWLDKFLTRIPTRYLVELKQQQTQGRTIKEQREIVFWFENAILDSNHHHALLVRFIEEVTYPVDWQTRALAEEDVRQTTTLMGWWYKKQK